MCMSPFKFSGRVSLLLLALRTPYFGDSYHREPLTYHNSEA